MKPVEFPEQTAVIAKNQPKYLPIPVYVDPIGIIIICWKLTWRERVKLLFTGIIWHRILTFHKPLQPIILEVDYPFLKKKESEKT